MKTINASELEAVPASFRGNVRFGRTTKLVDKKTGMTIIECMGVCTKADLIRSLEQTQKFGH